MLSKNYQVVGYLLLREVDIKKANSLSGHFVYGFPSVTGFKGYVHAMARNLAKNPDFQGISMRGVLVACHECEVYGKVDGSGNMRFSQTSFVASTSMQVNSLRGKSKRLPSILENGYVDTTVSLIIEVVSNRELVQSEKDALRKQVFDFTRKGRIAGGTVPPDFSEENVLYVEYEGLDDVAFAISNSYVLVDAEALMAQYLDENPDDNALTAMLRLCSKEFVPIADKDKDGSLVISMQYQPITDKYKGVVPISKGFQGISPALKNEFFNGSRSENEKGGITQYAESLYGLATWELPHVLRLKGLLRDAFWVYEYDAENSIYTVSQPNITTLYDDNGE